MKFRIVTMPGGETYFHEIAETLLYGLRHLGHDAERSASCSVVDRNLVLAPHLAREAVPAGTIIYNFEQLGASDEGSAKSPPEANGPILDNFFRRWRECTVWDYSAGHLAKWRAHGIAAKHVPLGYVPELTRIPELGGPFDGFQNNQDIDVLFYGAENRRRRHILRSLEEIGLRVQSLRGVWGGIFGEERDRWIARSKVVLNLHYYASKTFEIARVSYLLSNRKAVVTEQSSDEADYADLAGGMVSVPYEGLVEACVALVRDRARRDRLKFEGFRRFSERKESGILKEALANG